MFGPSRYTPASSAWSKPTRTLGSCCRANFPSTVSSTAGLSLEAQPAAFTFSVRRTFFVSDMLGFYNLCGASLCGAGALDREVLNKAVRPLLNHCHRQLFRGNAQYPDIRCSLVPLRRDVFESHLELS